MLKQSLKKDNNTTTIFGYGSLMNIKSLRKTAPRAKGIRPCKIKGFKRVFDLEAKRKIGPRGPIAVLDIKKDKNSEVNGVCFEVDKGGYEALVEREVLYRFVEVDVYSPENESCGKAFTVQANEKPRTSFKFDCQIQKEYLNTCLEGAKNFGERFYRDFLLNTYLDEERLKDAFRKKFLNLETIENREKLHR